MVRSICTFINIWDIACPGLWEKLAQAVGLFSATSFSIPMRVVPFVNLRCAFSSFARPSCVPLPRRILVSRIGNMSTKRKASAANGAVNGTAPKRAKNASLSEPHPLYKDAEEHGIVLRKFYPHEMSNARARAYNENKLPRPMEVVQTAQVETTAARRTVVVGDAVVHWWKMDLRISDNRALAMAAAKAKQAGVPLITLYVVSPQDWEAHFTSAIRVDFTLRTLEILKADLEKLDIPLHIETVEKRKEVPARIASLLHEWGANHIFANLEYEVDELRREAKMVKMLAEKGKAFEVVHDTCVVPPGSLRSGAGRQYAVYSPWYRSWMAHIHGNLDLLEAVDPPSKNPGSARAKFGPLFGSQIPDAPVSKRLPADEAKRYRSLWPAGEHEAHKRLGTFCKERIGSYAAKRNFPADNGTSSLSVHLASGTLSARACVRAARDHNSTKKLDGGSQGIQTWISEVAWRDFYKHVLVNWPYVW